MSHHGRGGGVGKYLLVLRYTFKLNMHNPVGWGCRIHRLHLCRGVRLPNACPVYDAKQSDGEVLVMLELRRMLSSLSLPLSQVHSGLEW